VDLTPQQLWYLIVGLRILPEFMLYNPAQLRPFIFKQISKRLD
jgi:hypothetical protein